MTTHHRASLQGNRSSGNAPFPWARGLGWFSIGLGLAEVLAPKALARWLGLRGQEGLVRAYGLREITNGIGLLRSEDPAPWVWGRVAGDVLDLATVAPHLEDANPQKGHVEGALVALAGITLVDVCCGVQLHRGVTRKENPDQHTQESDVERSLTIERPASELYQRWRDPQTLAQVMAHFAEVRSVGNGQTHWHVQGPAGRSLEWTATTVEDRPGEVLRWQSLPGSDLVNEGSVRFQPAPADRGTVVTLRFSFDPADGNLSGAVLKRLDVVPSLLAGKALRRFKSLVETGEIPTTVGQSAARADTR
ncbi:MAG TPA: SRPBCC family protein [Chthoniobacterales bacterium]